jgi:hypothetical protein
MLYTGSLNEILTDEGDDPAAGGEPFGCRVKLDSRSSDHLAGIGWKAQAE